MTRVCLFSPLGAPTELGYITNYKLLGKFHFTSDVLNSEECIFPCCLGLTSPNGNETQTSKPKEE